MSTPIVPSSAIKAAIFDIDGVLLDSRLANMEFYRSFLAEHGYTAISDEILAHGHHMNLRQAIAFMTQGPDERVDELWQLAGTLENYPDHLLSLPEDCRESLEALGRRFQLAIVTGRMREGINHFFRFSGLQALFTASVGYEDYTRPKPDGEPLLVACRRLGVEPRHAVYVGDAPLDYESALAAGTQFIAYGDGIAGAPGSVSTFHELTERLVPFRLDEATKLAEEPVLSLSNEAQRPAGLWGVPITSFQLEPSAAGRQQCEAAIEPQVGGVAPERLSQ